MKTYTEFYIVQICFIHIQKENQFDVMQYSYISYYIAFVANFEYCSIKYVKYLIKFCNHTIT